jgi:hypothetical protein
MNSIRYLLMKMNIHEDGISCDYTVDIKAYVNSTFIYNHLHIDATFFMQILYRKNYTNSTFLYHHAYILSKLGTRSDEAMR